MNFKVATVNNNNSCAELIYSVPNKNSITDALSDIGKICRSRLNQLGEAEKISERMEKELQFIARTDTAYEFLILKEIAELSYKSGYPVMIEGNVSGSVILYLLGVTSEIYYKAFKNDNYMPIELIWGTNENITIPCFSIRAAKSVCPLIQKRLNEKFGYAKSDETLYKRISLTDSSICEEIGKYAKETKENPEIKDFDNEVYIHALHNIANGKEDENAINFTKEIKSVSDCDFYTMIRIFGYLHGSFTESKVLKNIYDPYFFTSKEELFNKLVSYGISRETAADFIFKGITSKNDYIEILKKYNVSPKLINNFKNTKYLWSAASCISRVQIICTLAWYQIKYPQDCHNKNMI